MDQASGSFGARRRSRGVPATIIRIPLEGAIVLEPPTDPGEQARMRDWVRAHDELLELLGHVLEIQIRDIDRRAA